MLFWLSVLMAILRPGHGRGAWVAFALAQAACLGAAAVESGRHEHGEPLPLGGLPTRAAAVMLTAAYFIIRAAT